MVHIIGERYLQQLLKGLEKFRLTHIKRSDTRATRHQTQSHLNLSFEGPTAKYRIDELIVTCPEHTTIPAVATLVPRLDRESTILLCHELPGLAGRIKGLWRKDPPKILVGLPPSNTFTISGNDKSDSLATKILDSTTGWVADWYPKRELTLVQLENLVVRSTIETLSVVLNCDPKDLTKDQYQHIIYQLVAESCQILKAAYQEPLIDAGRMHRIIRERAVNYPKKFDLRKSMQIKSYAPIGYLNGQLCRLATKHKLPHRFNQLFQDLVQIKTISKDMHV